MQVDEPLVDTHLPTVEGVGTSVEGPSLFHQPGHPGHAPGSPRTVGLDALGGDGFPWEQAPLVCDRIDHDY